MVGMARLIQHWGTTRWMWQKDRDGGLQGAGKRVADICARQSGLSWGGSKAKKEKGESWGLGLGCEISSH